MRRELALRPERRPMPVKPPKAPLARTRSGAEANSVHLRGQRVEGGPDACAERYPINAEEPAGNLVWMT